MECDNTTSFVLKCMWKPNFFSLVWKERMGKILCHSKILQTFLLGRFLLISCLGDATVNKRKSLQSEQISHHKELLQNQVSHWRIIFHLLLTSVNWIYPHFLPWWLGMCSDILVRTHLSESARKLFCTASIIGGLYMCRCGVGRPAGLLKLVQARIPTWLSSSLLMTMVN